MRTDRVLRALLATTLLVSILAGVGTAIAVQWKCRAVQDLTSTSGTPAAAAAELRQALMAADVAAVSAFVARDNNRIDDVVRFEATYDASINQAQTALATITARSGARDAATDNILATFPGRLLDYSELVRIGLDHNRQGLPVAATYQLLAADSMRFQLLPAAAKLHHDASDRMAADYSRATHVPLLEIFASVVTITTLVLIQLCLARRTKRVFNVGMLTATVVAIGSLTWVSTASAAAVWHSNEAWHHGSELADQLTELRVAALTVRANDILSLIADSHQHGPLGYPDRFDELRVQVSGYNERARSASRVPIVEDFDQVVDNIQEWRTERSSVHNLTSRGKYTQAIERLLQPRNADALAGLDANLAAATEAARRRQDENLTSARHTLAGVPWGVLATAILMAASSAFGIWQRLSEFR